MTNEIAIIPDFNSSELTLGPTFSTLLKLISGNDFETSFLRLLINSGLSKFCF